MRRPSRSGRLPCRCHRSASARAAPARLRASPRSRSSWSRISDSSSRSRGPGSTPSCSTRCARARRNAASASAWRPTRYSAVIEQSPEPFAERMTTRQLRQRADAACGSVSTRRFQVDLHRAQPLFDQSVHRRGQARASMPARGSPVHSARAASMSPALRCRWKRATSTASGAMSRRYAAPVRTIACSPAPCAAGRCATAASSRPSAAAVAPHQLHQARHRHRRSGRQGERREHGLRPRRADVERLATVGGGA